MIKKLFQLNEAYLKTAVVTRVGLKSSKLKVYESIQLLLSQLFMCVFLFHDLWSALYII